MKRKKEVMSKDVFDKIVFRIKDENINPIYFNLGPNGEPLVDRQIFDRVKTLKLNFPDTPIYFPTNLSLANKEIIAKLLKSDLDHIVVSLNAYKADDYKKIMGLDYHRTIANLNLLLKEKRRINSDLKVYVKIAANPINKKTVDNFVKYWNKRVDGVDVSWVHSWAGAVKNDEGRSLRAPRYPCWPLFQQINIHSNGNIPLCCIDYDGWAVEGNVMTDKLIESVNRGRIAEIKKLHVSDQVAKASMCRNCRFCERGLYWLVA